MERFGTCLSHSSRETVGDPILTLFHLPMCSKEKKCSESFPGELFDSIVAFLLEKNLTPREVWKFKDEILWGAEPLIKKATEFKLDDSLHTFKLTYPIFSERGWDIEDDLDSCAVDGINASLLQNYFQNFDRQTEAGCKIAIDLILNEALVSFKYLLPSVKHIQSPQKGNDANSPLQQSSPINVYCDVPFSWKVPTSRQSRPIIIKDHIDRCIGRKLRPRGIGKCSLQSFLLIVAAKSYINIYGAVAQLVVYLGALRRTRLSRGRSNATVYGVASDGCETRFVMIQHDGKIKISKTFDTGVPRELKTVLGCINYLLKKSEFMAAAGESADILQEQDNGDLEMDANDNDYMNPPSLDSDSDEDSV